MITIVGSQSREPIEDTEYVFVKEIDEKEIILREKDGDPNNRLSYELWVRNDHFAGYTIIIDGKGYEFVRSALQGDLWWANVTPACNESDDIDTRNWGDWITDHNR